MSKTLLEKQIISTADIASIEKNKTKVSPALRMMAILCTQVKLAMFFDNRSCGCNCPKEIYEEVKAAILDLGYTITNEYLSNNSQGFQINW